MSPYGFDYGLRPPLRMIHYPDGSVKVSLRREPKKSPLI